MDNQTERKNKKKEEMNTVAWGHIHNTSFSSLLTNSPISLCYMGGVKTERVFPGLSVLQKNNKMEVLYPEK
jgi:hypothetical protein